MKFSTFLVAGALGSGIERVRSKLLVIDEAASVPPFARVPWLISGLIGEGQSHTSLRSFSMIVNDEFNGPEEAVADVRQAMLDFLYATQGVEWVEFRFGHAQGVGSGPVYEIVDASREIK